MDVAWRGVVRGQSVAWRGMLGACALAVLFGAAPAHALPRVRHEALPRGWEESVATDGSTLYTRLGKKASAKITLYAPEPVRESPTLFAQTLAKANPPDFVDRSEVQTFNNPDGRVVVAMDGRGTTPAQPYGRRVWIFDHGFRVQAQLFADEAPEFQKEASTFMALVASIRIRDDGQVGAPIAEGPAPSGPVTTPSVPVHGAPASGHPVDRTLQYQPPAGWKRVESGNAIWLRAPPSPDGAATFILLTPAERLSTDFNAWFNARLAPSAELRILSRGRAERSQASTGYELIQQRLTLEVRGREHHEQQVLAAKRGHAAVLVALDATSPAALAAHEAEFRTFLSTLDIRPEIAFDGEGQPPAAVPAAAPGTGAFPKLTVPPGWSVAGGDRAWRTYTAPGAGAGNFCTMMVSVVTAAGDPARTLADARKSIAPGAPAKPESIYLGHGVQLLRAVDRSGAGGRSLVTQTAVLSGQGKQVVLILRASSDALYDRNRAAFEQVLGSVEL